MRTEICNTCGREWETRDMDKCVICEKWLCHSCTIELDNGEGWACDECYGERLIAQVEERGYHDDQV